MARDLADEPPVGTGARVGLRDRRQAVEIEPRVGDVLIGGAPAQPFGHEISRGAEARGLAFDVPWERGRPARIPHPTLPRLRGRVGWGRRDARAPRGKGGRGVEHGRPPATPFKPRPKAPKLALRT